jgi:glycosyltransferase involved in cell wall biosynthesis
MNRKLHIAQVITGSEYTGGAETHLLELIKGLQSQGHRCTVLAGPPDGMFCRQVCELGVPIHTVPSLRKRLNPVRDGMALAEVTYTLRAARPDIVAAHTAKASFLTRIAAYILRIPCVFTPHGWSIVNRQTGECSRAFLTLERLAGHFSNTVITVCEEERRLAEAFRIIESEKIAVVHNGIPDGAGLADPTREPVTLAMPARFDAPKDHVTLLKALATLVKYPWTLRLAGAGRSLPSIRRLARTLGIERRVKFLGECSDVPRLLAESQIFVLSSKIEAFPISILEAMRAGLPVVASNVGGVREAVEEGRTGYLVSPGDPQALGERLRTLFADPLLRLSLGRQGRRRYLDHFTAERMVAETIAIYAAAIDRGMYPALESSTKPMVSTASR